MQCSTCGKKMKKGDVYCQHCGAAVAQNGMAESSGTAKASNASVSRKSGKKVLFLTLGAAAIIAAVVGVVAGMRTAQAKREEQYRRELRRAERYLDDLEYEQAIASYQALIEIDPRNPDLYIGMADAYIGLGDYDAAYDILEEGYRMTGNEGIAEYMAEVREGLDTDATLRGLVMALDENGGYANIGNLGGIEVSLAKSYGEGYDDSSYTDSEGWYEFDGLCAGKYVLEVDADGYLPIRQTIDVYPGQEMVSNPTTALIPESAQGRGTASGWIIDAVNGYGVEGLTLNIREGYNVQRGEVVEHISTDYSGYYQTPEMEAGYYTVEIVDEREVDEPYLRSYTSIRVYGGRNIDNQNGSVSTDLVEGQIRIVLTWGEQPFDLDSHLFCSLDAGWIHHNFYSDRMMLDPETGERIVDLDLDDISSYGPETTTIYDPRDGDYSFGVYNYSENSLTGLAESGAVVQVYDGTSALPSYVFYVPQGEGYYWEVFRYDSREQRVIPLNHLYDYYYEEDYLDYSSSTYLGEYGDYYGEGYGYGDDGWYGDGWYGYDENEGYFDYEDSAVYGVDMDAVLSAYADYLENEGVEPSDGGMASTTVYCIYLNDDDIPELVVDYGYAAAGASIYTYMNGTVDMAYLRRGEFSYWEKQNVIENSAGNSGYYTTEFLQIENGKFVSLGAGVQSVKDEYYYTDDWSRNEVWDCEWEGAEVSYTEYESILESYRPDDDDEWNPAYYIGVSYYGSGAIWDAYYGLLAR